jgi:hypothetical protein
MNPGYIVALVCMGFAFVVLIGGWYYYIADNYQTSTAWSAEVITSLIFLISYAVVFVFLALYLDGISPIYAYKCTNQSTRYEMGDSDEPATYKCNTTYNVFAKDKSFSGQAACYAFAKNNECSTLEIAAAKLISNCYAHNDVKTYVQKYAARTVYTMQQLDDPNVQFDIVVKSDHNWLTATEPAAVNYPYVFQPNQFVFLEMTSAPRSTLSGNSALTRKFKDEQLHEQHKEVGGPGSMISGIVCGSILLVVVGLGAYIYKFSTPTTHITSKPLLKFDD